MNDPMMNKYNLSNGNNISPFLVDMDDVVMYS